MGRGRRQCQFRGTAWAPLTGGSHDECGPEMSVSGSQRESGKEFFLVITTHFQVPMLGSTAETPVSILPGTTPSATCGTRGRKFPPSISEMCFTKRSFEDPDEHFVESDTSFNYDWKQCFPLNFRRRAARQRQCRNPNRPSITSRSGAALLQSGVFCFLHQYCHSSRRISIHRCSILTRSFALTAA